jgi:hypothetical protein
MPVSCSFSSILKFDSVKIVVSGPRHDPMSDTLDGVFGSSAHAHAMIKKIERNSFI